MMKTCPYCGSSALHRQRKWPGIAQVLCMRCRAVGPQGVDHDAAKAAWNARAPVKEVDEADAFGVAKEVAIDAAATM